jgi:hypothetical protein
MLRRHRLYSLRKRVTAMPRQRSWRAERWKQLNVMLCGLYLRELTGRPVRGQVTTHSPVAAQQAYRR